MTEALGQRLMGPMASRVTLVTNALCALLLLWLYGGDAWDAARVSSAEVCAYLEPPNLPFTLSALLATAVAAGATVLGVAQRREGRWRGYRLLPIVAVVVLFVDLFIFAGNKSPLGSAERTALTLRSLADAASAAATASAVPSDPRQLQQLLEQFGAPAYLLKGEPAKAWTLVIRRDCAGPVSERKDEPVGTVFYCLAADGKTAWITAVALPAGTFFGSPALFARGGEPVAAVVNAVPVEPPAAAPADQHLPPGESWFETTDSGR